MTDIQTALFALRDPAYQAFQSKLIPTIDPQTVIGVRMPALRKLAREIAGTPVAEGFLQELPRRYYEENNLRSCGNRSAAGWRMRTPILSASAWGC